MTRWRFHKAIDVGPFIGPLCGGTAKLTRFTGGQHEPISLAHSGEEAARFYFQYLRASVARYFFALIKSDIFSGSFRGSQVQGATFSWMEILILPASRNQNPN